MQQLKDRIRREGKVLPGNIIKVDGFLNHRVDPALMTDIADEFSKYFDTKNITVVLTAEASGIPLAMVCAQRYGVPMVFAKKAKSDNIEGGLYQSEIFSYTYKKKVTLLVAQECPYGIITTNRKSPVFQGFSVIRQGFSSFSNPKNQAAK